MGVICIIRPLEDYEYIRRFYVLSTMLDSYQVHIQLHCTAVVYSR